MIRYIWGMTDGFQQIQESLQHRILLLTCSQALRTIDAISALHHSRYSIIRRRANITMYSRTAVIAGFESGYLAAFLWGIHGLYNGTISFGMMTAYLQLAGQIQRPLAELARLLPGLIQSHTAFSRISEIESLPKEQGNSLLSGTIRYNLRTAKPDASEEEMRAALHDAAADFVFDLKFGLETTCGEHGDGLSEGQAQRISIARGLLRPGTILLLDEISAALDEETEKQLMQRLSKRTGSHTILFVTHRPGVIPFCDDILRV